MEYLWMVLHLGGGSAGTEHRRSELQFAYCSVTCVALGKFFAEGKGKAGP